MRFSPSSTYLRLARGAVKSYDWKVYIKKATARNEALSSGTWIDVTSRITAIPEQGSSIEWAIGEFTSNMIQLEGEGLAWWNGNIFNASTSQLLELKIEFVLRDGADVASDTVVTFSGWIDKVGRLEQNKTDSVIFSVYTAQEIGDRLAGENISTQYKKKDVDGAGTDGLYFFDIPNMYVTDANVASYVLKTGVHEIAYDYNGGTYQVRLDDGAWVTLTTDNTTYTLGNGETSALDTERLKVYVGVRARLPIATVTEKIVVVTSGSTLPKQWYRFLGVKSLLEKIYAQIGIDSVTFDNLTLASYDGGYRLSFVERPPDDEAVLGRSWAIETDGTDLYIAIDNVVYKRTQATGAYSTVCTLGSTEKISRLLYNSRNNHLWIFHGTNANGNGKVSRFDFPSTLQAAITLQTTIDFTWHNAVTLYDYNYTGSSWKYGLVFVDENFSAATFVRFVDGSAWGTVSPLFTASTYYTTPPGAFRARFVHQKATGKVRYSVVNSSSQRAYRQITVNASGTWIDEGEFLAGREEYKYAAYNTNDDRIIYWNESTGNIESTDTTSAGSAVLHLTLDRRDFFSDPHNFFYAATTHQKVFFTTWGYHETDGVDHRTPYLYSVTGTSAAVIVSEFGTYTDYSAITQIGASLYGVDVMGRLFQYSTTAALYVRTADFEGKSVREALNMVLQPHLISIISSTKAARVYRRGDDTGVPQTSGNTLSATKADPSDLIRHYSYLTKAEFVRISNGTHSVTYDGNAFDAAVLTNTRSVTIDNPLLPDEILSDLAFRMFKYFERDWTMYELALENVPLFQFEPFDEVSLAFSDTKVLITDTGPIYETIIHPNASMTVRALIGSTVDPY